MSSNILSVFLGLSSSYLICSSSHPIGHSTRRRQRHSGSWLICWSSRVELELLPASSIVRECANARIESNRVDDDVMMTDNSRSYRSDFQRDAQVDTATRAWQIERCIIIPPHSFFAFFLLACSINSGWGLSFHAWIPRTLLLHTPPTGTFLFLFLPRFSLSHCSIDSLRPISLPITWSVSETWSETWSGSGSGI